MKNTIIELLREELEREAPVTRKMLSTIPDDKLDWQPHPKSMSVRQLATHLGEIPGWIDLVINTEEIDFAVNPGPPQIKDTTELLQAYDHSVEKGRAALANAKPEQLDNTWTMRGGDVIYATESKYSSIRHSLAQMIHHRAQMGVFLRLLNVPIPGTYGPSADEMSF